MSRIILTIIQWFFYLGIGLVVFGLKFHFPWWAIIIGVVMLNLLPMLCFISLFLRRPRFFCTRIWG